MFVNIAVMEAVDSNLADVSRYVASRNAVEEGSNGATPPTQQDDASEFNSGEDDRETAGVSHDTPVSTPSVGEVTITTSSAAVTLEYAEGCVDHTPPLPEDTPADACQETDMSEVIEARSDDQVFIVSDDGVLVPVTFVENVQSAGAIEDEGGVDMSSGSEHHVMVASVVQVEPEAQTPVPGLTNVEVVAPVDTEAVHADAGISSTAVDGPSTTAETDVSSESRDVVSNELRDELQVTARDAEMTDTNAFVGEVLDNCVDDGGATN